MLGPFGMPGIYWVVHKEILGDSMNHKYLSQA